MKAGMLLQPRGALHSRITFDSRGLPMRSDYWSTGLIYVCIGYVNNGCWLMVLHPDGSIIYVDQNEMKELQ
jgi:hypothetical protein